MRSIRNGVRSAYELSKKPTNCGALSELCLDQRHRFFVCNVRVCRSELLADRRLEEHTGREGGVLELRGFFIPLYGDNIPLYSDN